MTGKGVCYNLVKHLRQKCDFVNFGGDVAQYNAQQSQHHLMHIAQSSSVKSIVHDNSDREGDKKNINNMFFSK